MVLPLESDKTYRIVYQFNGAQTLFDTDENYLHLLKLYSQFIQPAAETYAYCLSPLQANFLLKIKPEKELFDFLKQSQRIPESNLTYSEYSNLSVALPGSTGNVFSLQLSKLFSAMLTAYLEPYASKKVKISYTVNRTIIERESDFLDALFELHSLPLSQSITDKPEQWRYGSFAAYLSDKNTLLNRERAFNNYASKSEFYTAQNKYLEKIKSKIALHLYDTI